VPADDRSCPCGQPIQLRDHILASCPTYGNQHGILKTAAEVLVTSDILRTRSGVEALIAFIHTTNAFKKQQPPTPPD
ncbi:hypothetical protein SCLCIDRAFT_89551, partial [Scleroderma citrinum Foug A]